MIPIFCIRRGLAPGLLSLFVASFNLAGIGSARAETANSVTQYGIRWTFDKAYPVGQFVTGDWWVVGPVTVVGVSPAPRRAPADEPSATTKSIYGTPSLSDDKTYRNGSMIVVGPPKNGAWTQQGYDSRALNFDGSLSVKFPVALPVNQSLISTISSETYENGKLKTPFIAGTVFPGKPHLTEELALDTAAVLTCVDKAPPADAFRPAYAGTDKKIYETKDIQWQLLPKLKAPASTPDWDKMNRVFERPWLDHIGNWVIQYSAPGNNQPAYGGDVTHAYALASLMLLLDVPKEQKEKLMISYLQKGIDLHGLALAGRMWFSDGGHWMGRKWPMLFASLMLNAPELRTFPVVDAAKPILYDKIMLEPGSAGPAPTTFFSEDLDTYYGKAADGQTVLWRVTYHSYSRQPYLEKPFPEWTEDDKFQNNYLWIPACWPAYALAALSMKQKATWNHDAFFDFNDWWMAPGQTRYDSKTGQKKPTRDGTDKFIQEVWDTYRTSLPEQAGGKDNLAWQWNGAPDAEGKMDSRKGRWVENAKPTP